MSSRRFPDFLTAFEEYADDDFSPPQFNTWSALSVIAGALERKVWLRWSIKYTYFPNIYVMLVSKPGVGKSVSSGGAVSLLREVSRRTGHITLLPNQMTEAKFIELLSQGRSFTDNSSGKDMTHFQNAGYFYASEASNELKNVFGDFISCLTAMYDCPNNWERSVKKDFKRTPLKNVCMNFIACCTFDYLGKLINDENIMGGFASRLIYVVQRNSTIKKRKFQDGLNDESLNVLKDYENALIEDLTTISKLTGPMAATSEVHEAWSNWNYEYETMRQLHPSEKVQSIWSRTNPNILKVAMLLSVSESNSRLIEMRHWEKAVNLVLTVQDQVPGIFRESRANASVGSPTTISNALMSLILKNPGIGLERVKALAVCAGHSKNTVFQVMDSLMLAGVVGRGDARPGGDVEAVLLGNPDHHL